MDKRLLLSLCALLFGAFAAMTLEASASELDYRYGDARYQRVDLDNGVDGDGFGFSGWYQFHQRVFAVGEVAFLDFDNGVDVTQFAVGAGTFLPLSANWDGIATLTFRRASIDAGPNDQSETGFGLQVGVRGQPMAKVEARAMLNYVDVAGSDTSVTLTGDYYFTPRVSAGVAVNFGGDAKALSVGGRFYFGSTK